MAEAAISAFGTRFAPPNFRFLPYCANIPSLVAEPDHMNMTIIFVVMALILGVAIFGLLAYVTLNE